MVVAGERRGLGQPVTFVNRHAELFGPATGELLRELRRRGKAVADRVQIDRFTTFHHQLERRRHTEQHRHTMLGDQTLRLADVETALQDDRRADVQPRVEQRVLAVAVKERYRQQDAVVRLHGTQMVERVHRRADVLVRERRAFRETGRAGGVKDRRRIIRIHRLAQNRIGIVSTIGTCRRTLTKRDSAHGPAVFAGDQVRFDGVGDLAPQHLDKTVRADDQLRPTITKDVTHFVRRQSRADRNGHRADTKTRVVPDHEGGHVPDDNGDPVAPPDPGIEQHSCGRTRQPIDVAIGQRLTLEHDRVTIGEQTSAHDNVLADIHDSIAYAASSPVRFAERLDKRADRFDQRALFGDAAGKAIQQILE